MTRNTSAVFHSAGYRTSILGEVDEKLRLMSEKISAQCRDQYDELKMALKGTDQNRESGSDDTGSINTEIQRLLATISAMNHTVLVLQQQNEILLQQSQELRAQTSVLRAQNEAMTVDADAFSRLRRKQELLEADQDRIITTEEKVADHTTKISSLQTDLEWLTSRVDQLSDVTDAAQAEASSAAETANRAMEISRRAISIIKKRKPIGDGIGDDTTPGKLKQPLIPPSDCLELYRMGYNVSGVYRIRPRLSPQSFEVYCEQAYNGGGWTVMQRRRNGSVDFDRDWNAYADGFGDPNGELWIGNQKLYYLTNEGDCTLQVLLLDWEGHRAYAEYDFFRIQGNPDNYAAIFGPYSRGNAGDGLRGTTRDGSRNALSAGFTTANQDNDQCQPCVANTEGDTFENCAELQGGGWWFRACSDSNLNGRYVLPQDFSSCGTACYGIQWRTWRAELSYSLKASIMLLRRNEPITEG